MIYMKPIQSSLNRWMEQNDAFKQRHEAMKQDILSNPRIQHFLQQHPEITDEHIEKRLNKLHEYTSQSIRCEQCENYNACKNIVQGYYPVLSFVNNDIHVAYEKCPSYESFEKQEENKNLIQSVNMPKDILHAKLNNLYRDDPRRSEAVTQVLTFVNEAKDSLPEKGLFLSGPFGVGKTYLLGAIANELQAYKITSMLIYMPELVREMREAIQTNTVQDKIDQYKRADILMLDDIGAETMSAWFRDEVLGAILQYRMMEKLPVFFTSNYTMKELEQTIATTTKGEFEEVKAGRIMERIRQLSNEIIVVAKNYRNV